MTTRTHYQRLRESGGKVIAVRMTADQVAQLNRLRREGESESKCINRMIAVLTAYGISLDGFVSTSVKR